MTGGGRRPPRAGWRRRVVGWIDRLPVGRATVLRAGRAALRTLDRSPATEGPRRLPQGFTIHPAPRPVKGPWPEPPVIDGAAEIVRRRAAEEGGDRPYDIDLFEALNAEYASKPVVEQAVGFDEASLTERAEGRLERVHRSIDLAGRRVRRLMDETDAGPGLHLLTITANSGGERLDPGIYFYRIEAAEGVRTGRFVVLR